jgi:uncharacterized protein
LLERGHNVSLCVSNEPDGNSWTPLHNASINGHNNCIITLLDYNANIEARGMYGETALQLASRFSNCNITLIDRGANVHVKNENGRTPLHFTSYRGYKDCLITLLNAGGHINERCNEGRTPLHEAVRGHGGQLDCIITLLERGADIDIKDNNGQTPFDLINDQTKDEIKVFITEYLLIPIKEPASE